MDSYSPLNVPELWSCGRVHDLRDLHAVFVLVKHKNHVVFHQMSWR